MDIERVGNAIAFLRKRAGFTQKDIADRIGISDKAVSKWERGLALPDISCLTKLAILLDTDADSLLAGDVAFHNDHWRGILVLDECQVNALTMIYDKPLVYYLFGYFLLVGIREILIVGTTSELDRIRLEMGDGERLGIHLCYTNDTFCDALKENRDFVEGYHTMVVYGYSFLYGVGQSRFFRRAMEQMINITVLSIPKKSKDPSRKICFDEQKKIVDNNNSERIKTQYEYSGIPVMFFPAGTLLPCFSEDSSISEALFQCMKDGRLYTEVLDRGFVEINLNSWETVSNASNFVKIMQDESGVNLYCIEEIAWRRGMISHDALGGLAQKKQGTGYGQYLLDLYNMD